jgi:hypothetical protein
MKTLLVAVALLSLLVGVQAQSVPITGLVVQGTDYDATTKATTAHLLNASAKEVTGYYLAFRITMPDGTQSAPGYTGLDLCAIESGAKFDVSLVQQEGPANATVDVVVYSDGTAEAQDQWLLKSVIAERQGRIAGMQKVNAILAKNMTSANPTAEAARELKQELDNPTNTSGHYKAELQSAITNLSRSRPDQASELRSMSGMVESNNEAIAKESAHPQVKGVQP